MKTVIHVFSFLSAFTLATTAAQAGTIISEKFSGSDSTDLVGTPTPDGNNWTGALGEAADQEEATGGTADQEEASSGTETAAAPKFSVKQDGSTGGIAFTAYHEFAFKQGQVYTLEAVLSPHQQIRQPVVHGGIRFGCPGWRQSAKPGQRHDLRSNGVVR